MTLQRLTQFSKDRSGSDIIRKIAKLLLLALVFALVFVAVNTILHMTMHVCLLHFARFSDTEMTPIVCGYPSEEGLEKAKRGEIVLGGCGGGLFAAVCPHCHWPAKFSDSDSDANAGGK